MSTQAGLHPLHGYGSRPQPAQQRARAQASADYTLTHGGRQVRLGPVAFWIVVGSLVIMALWSAATATYFAFHDDVLTRLIARQADMQFAYEDRIADLRSQVDRITSRQMLDQEKVEQNLGDILKRQAALESRAGAISAIGGDPMTTGSIRPSGRAPAAPAPSSANPKPSPISDTVIFTAPPDREARLESRTPPPAMFQLASANGTANAPRARAANMSGALGKLQTSLDRVEARQAQILNELEEQADGKAQRMRTVLADLGMDTSKVPAGAVGGPFIPVRPPSANASHFDKQLYRVAVARAQVDRFTKALVHVPVRKPLPELDMSSGFGVRYDPFIRTPAMHSGLDFRGDTGDPVKVTANGTVTHAGWQGGYGKMVEVEHGHGFSTRYGHLSAIDVKVGQVVKIGQVVGRLGSTGRSTGPHLHYETRVDGDAVDPQKFLRAGIRLGNPG